MERGTLVDDALGPNLATVAMNDSLHTGQPDATARELGGRVQALEGAEQFVDERHVEPGSIVAHEAENPDCRESAAATTPHRRRT